MLTMPTPRQRVCQFPVHPDRDRVAALALPSLYRLLVGYYYPATAVDDTALAVVNVVLWAQAGGLPPEPAAQPDPVPAPTDLGDRCAGGGA